MQTFSRFLMMLFLTASLCGGGVNAQSDPDWFFWVYPNHPDAYPNTAGVASTTNSAVLNSLFTTYDMKRYHEAFPGAPVGSILQNAYTLAFDGDMEAFYQDLDATGLFDAIYLWGDDAITLSETSSTSLVADPNVTCATPLSYNDPYPAFPAGEPNYDSDWNIDDTDADCAWTITQGDPNIIIGYVDSEFYDQHPELIGKKLPDVEMSPGAEAYSVSEGCRHGTATMADAVAIPNNGQFIAGMGYNTRAAGYVVRTTSTDFGCSPSGSGTWAGLWLAGYTDNRPIVNISISGIGASAISSVQAPPFGTLIAHEAVKLIINSGTLIVAAAGRRYVNSSGNVVNSQGHSTFGDIPGYLIVGGIDINKRHAPTNSPSYPEIDMCAPSTRVNSLSYDDQFNLTVSASRGDSHAAPFVASAAALCLAVNPCLTPIELETILKNNTDPIADAHDYPGLVGTGYLNVYKAVLAASEKLPDTQITTTETWDYPRRVDGNLTIAAGAELTITSTVGFSPFSRVIVEPGGRLIMNGAHLKPDCDNADNTWSGIEVKGNPTASQFNLSSQGFVDMDNSTIEGADIGVSLINRQTYTQGGGVLFADDSQFINCKKGVIIAKYENFFLGGSTPTANLSHLDNCDFIINDDYAFSVGGRHLQLDRVTRVDINGCLLTDERSSYTDAAELHNGIWSSNATYVVRKSEINNMRYGIQVENIKSGRTFQLRDNTFAQNFMGVSVRAVDNFEATNNTFTVGDFAGPTTDFTFPDRQTGMHVDQSSGFFIEDNAFNAASNLPSTAEPVGLAVNNTNVGVAGDLTSEANSVFRNGFTGLYRANVANGDNDGENFVGGLSYFCNQNTTNSCTDFTVFDGTIAPIQQAVDGKAAGNTFTQDDSCNSFSDFDNSEGNFITYHYYDQSTGNVQEPIYVSSTNFSNIVATENLCTNDDSSPGPLPNGGDGNLVADFPTEQQNYLALQQQYSNLIDDGDTEALLLDLANLIAAEKAVMWQQLNQISPYLSAEVLLSFTEHALFTSNQKRVILEANPESLSDEALKNSIKNGGWFTTAQRNSIKAAEQNTTVRDTLENDLRAAQLTLQGLTQALENYYQIDEVENGLDYNTQANWAANGNSLDGYLRSIDNRLWAADTTAANSEIATLLAMDMTTAQSDAIADFVQLKNLELTLLNSNRTYDELTTSEIETLQKLANNPNRAGIQAQNWLHLLGISHYQAEAYWASSTAARGIGKGSTTTSDQPMLSDYLRVQPNPSNGLFYFQLTKDDALVAARLQVYNLHGQLQYEQQLQDGNQLIWQPQTAKAGFYFFVLQSQEGQVLQQGKLVYLPN